MTRPRWMISLLLVYHLVALTVAAFPSPAELEPFRSNRSSAHDDPLAQRLKPVLDRSVAALTRFEPRLFAALEPARIVTRPYVSAGLTQHWNMFANPSAVDRYVRLAYYVSADPLAPQVERFGELILPVDRQERLWYFRGKSIRNWLDTYFVERARREQAAETEDFSKQPSATNELSPIVRYFRDRFARERLVGAATIVRTELWCANVQTLPRGQDLTERLLDERATSLRARNTREGRAVARYGYPALGAAEHEADLTWVLEHVEAGEARR